MKTLIAIFLAILAFGYSESAKANNIDSLKSELKSSAFPQDSLIILKVLTESYQSISIDSAFYYGQIAIGQAGKLNDTASLADVYNYLGVSCYNGALYEKALEYIFQSLKICYETNDSIYSQESKNKLAEFQNKYKFEKKEQEIKLLKAEQ